MLQAVDHAVHLFRCAAHLRRITPRSLMLSQPRPRATTPHAAAGVGRQRQQQQQQQQQRTPAACSPQERRGLHAVHNVLQGLQHRSCI